MSNKTITILILTLVFLGGLLFFYRSDLIKQKTPAIVQTSQQTNSSQKWERKTNEQASVTVAITPLDLSAQSAEWKFNVVMDTHAIELDQDLVKNTVLIDDQGKEYKPTSWEGPVGGHHREGVLIFNQIIPIPKSVELKITGIADTVRTFIWQLK